MAAAGVKLGAEGDRVQAAGRRPLVNFNLDDADLPELVKAISNITGYRFIYGGKLRQIKATVYSPEKVSANEAYSAFLSILETNGMTVIPHGRFLKIVETHGRRHRHDADLRHRVARPRRGSLRHAALPARAHRRDRHGERPQQVQDEGRRHLRLRAVEPAHHHRAGVERAADDAHRRGDRRRRGRRVDVRRAAQLRERHGARERSSTRSSTCSKPAARRAPAARRRAAGAGGGRGGSVTAAGGARIVADERGNSLILVANDSDYQRLLELIKRMDVKQSGEGEIHVHPLQYAACKDLSQTLNQILGTSGLERRSAVRAPARAGRRRAAGGATGRGGRRGVRGAAAAASPTRSSRAASASRATRRRTRSSRPRRCATTPSSATSSTSSIGRAARSTSRLSSWM